MARRWFAFLAPALAVGVKAGRMKMNRMKVKWIAALILVSSSLLSGARAGFVLPCFADGSPASAAEPSPPSSGAGEPRNEIDQSFLLLPAFDLEATSSQAQSVRVGDSVVFHLQGDPQALKSLPPTLNIAWPPGTEDMTTSVAVDDKTAGEDRHFKVTFIKAGKVTLPSLGLAEDSKKFLARTNPITVDVESSIAKTDPKPKEAVPALPPEKLGFPVWTLVVAGIVFLALIIAGVHWLILWSRKRRLEASKKPKGPPPTEDQIAIEALKKLEAQGHLRKGEFKKFYFGISDILKHYIGARYKFDAAESTTDEMLDYLDRNSGVQDHVITTLREMYEKLDLVKFTDHIPVAIEGSELLDQAKQIVNQTKKQIVVAPVGAPGVVSGDKK